MTTMTNNLNTLTVVQALKGLKDKEFSCVDLVSSCLKQISAIDPKINAYITVTQEQALKQAHEVDELIKVEGAEVFIKYPLLGIPYACKDNFSTKGIETTAGSNVLKGYIPPFDATVIKKLSDAGAILLGKTNMDAFAHGSSTEESDFFVTKNPWDITRVPGGSSGGSAAAVASDMCLFALGTETAESIRGPASWCGVVGLKPSYGRVSRYGVVAMASSIDSPGPITKTVEDAALVLKVIAGNDINDATSLPDPVSDYMSELANFEANRSLDKPLKGLKIGKPASYFDIELEEGVREKVLAAVEHFKALGAEIVDVDLLSPKYAMAVYTILQRSEVSSNLARLTGVRYGNSRDTFGFEAKKRSMLGIYTLSTGYYDAYYSKAQKVRTLIVENFKKAFEEVDLIIGPTVPCVATKIGDSAKSSMFGEMMDMLAEPSSVSGLAGISVACGLSEKMPVGVQLISKINCEKTLFNAAHAFEKTFAEAKLKPALEDIN